MLKITVKGKESFNEETQQFIEPTFKEITLNLEHSLISLSKWESTYHKPFLNNEEKTVSELKEYIRCMTVSPVNVDPTVYEYLTADDYKKINDYIGNPMTATWFNNRNKKQPNNVHKNEQITSELIYYWMITCTIPFECEKWHLNRLLTLIRVCNIKNNPGKKMSGRELLANNAALNAARRKQLNTKG